MFSVAYLQSSLIIIPVFRVKKGIEGGKNGAGCFAWFLVALFRIRIDCAADSDAAF
jgi:hypothetical protein